MRVDSMHHAAYKQGWVAFVAGATASDSIDHRYAAAWMAGYTDAMADQHDLRNVVPLSRYCVHEIRTAHHDKEYRIVDRAEEQDYPSPGVIPEGVASMVYSNQNVMLTERVRLEEAYLAEAHYVVAQRMDGFGIWCPSSRHWAADRVFSRVKRAFDHRRHMEDDRRPGTVAVARGEPVEDNGEDLPEDSGDTLSTTPRAAVGGLLLPRALDLGDEEEDDA